MFGIALCGLMLLYAHLGAGVTRPMRTHVAQGREAESLMEGPNWVVIDATGKTTVYPNPAKDKLIITVNNYRENTQARLLDVNGKQLQLISIYGQSTSLDINRLPNGLYIVRFADGQVEKFEKILWGGGATPLL